MSRRVFFLDLKDDPDLIAEYEGRHAPGAVWPEILDDLRRRGFAEMQIWRARDRLVMIADVADPPPDVARTPAQEALVNRWEAEMDVYQRRLPALSTDPKWMPAHCIFDLDENP